MSRAHSVPELIGSGSDPTSLLTDDQPRAAARLKILPSRGHLSTASSENLVDSHLVMVDRLLAGVMDELAQVWAELPDDEGAVDILGAADLPGILQELMDTGGKRIRPVMSYLGWLTAGGRDRDRGYAEVVRAGAALDMVHLFALVHDDVMDESASRRGRPTVHVQARNLHAAGAGTGSGQRFGESIAILVGDLAHAEAGYLVAELPPAMRRIWRILVAELVAGQRRDLAGCAAGRRDLAYARTVARMKSGRYTVERPLQLGAVAAEAPPHVADRLAAYGKAVGEAFALRDDLLGIWGDPASTGKPAGDDLISGKPTVILALAERSLENPKARAALGRVGTSEFDGEDLLLLQQHLRDDGIADAVEQMITRHVDDAMAALDHHDLDPDGVGELGRMAHRIAWRNR